MVFISGMYGEARRSCFVSERTARCDSFDYLGEDFMEIQFTVR